MPMRSTVIVRLTCRNCLVGLRNQLSGVTSPNVMNYRRKVSVSYPVSRGKRGENLGEPPVLVFLFVVSAMKLKKVEKCEECVLQLLDVQKNVNANFLKDERFLNRFSRDPPRIYSRIFFWLLADGYSYLGTSMVLRWEECDHPQHIVLRPNRAAAQLLGGKQVEFAEVASGTTLLLGVLSRSRAGVLNGSSSREITPSLSIPEVVIICDFLIKSGLTSNVRTLNGSSPKMKNRLKKKLERFCHFRSLGRSMLESRDSISNSEPPSLTQQGDRSALRAELGTL
ncbi:hypothetical protein J6590_083723 [Homalodisca vitripennis]|nr:hypothetical protein J6590_083723 [Homalodisca vitripennis]